MWFCRDASTIIENELMSNILQIEALFMNSDLKDSYDGCMVKEVR